MGIELCVSGIRGTDLVCLMRGSHILQESETGLVRSAADAPDASDVVSRVSRSASHPLFQVTRGVSGSQEQVNHRHSMQSDHSCRYSNYYAVRPTCMTLHLKYAEAIVERAVSITGFLKSQIECVAPLQTVI